METPVIQENINRLKGEVSEYSTGTNYFSNSIFERFYKSSIIKAYIIVPIVVLLFLCYIRPDFVKDDSVNDVGDVVRVLSYKKVLIYWVIISVVLMVGIFGYNYKVGNLDN